MNCRFVSQWVFISENVGDIKEETSEAHPETKAGQPQIYSNKLTFSGVIEFAVGPRNHKDCFEENKKFRISDENGTKTQGPRSKNT